ncbi:hypothetical protein OIU76_025658 [Salix suchowensis]|nr:hypothetical protein OIU76_025658 [Salix suchowensis]
MGGQMGCLKCFISDERLGRKSLEKSIREYHDAKTLASFASVSFKTGFFSQSVRPGWVYQICLVNLLALANQNILLASLAGIEFGWVNEITGQPSQVKQLERGNISADIFTFRELATATKNFSNKNLIGEGGFGRVYKGLIAETNQVVAVKQLDRNGFQGNREFLVEVLMLSLLHHPNLVNMVGYCADGEQRILVYDYMVNGSLEDHLLVIDNSRPTGEKNLVSWATPLFKDRKKLTLIADPLLKGNYPLKGLYQALAVAAMCLQEEALTRPLMADVVTALEFLAVNDAPEEMAVDDDDIKKSSPDRDGDIE